MCFVVVLAILAALTAFVDVRVSSQAAYTVTTSGYADRNDTQLQVSFIRHLQQTNRTSNESKVVPDFLLIRERRRQERIRFIQNSILTRLGMSSRHLNGSARTTSSPMLEHQNLPQIYSTIRKKGSKMPMSGDVPRNIIFEKSQTFFPSCTIPLQIDQSRWSPQSESEMKLYFDLNVTQQGDSRSEMLVTLAKLRLKRKDYLNPQRTGDGRNETISIAVYQYLKPLKANKKDRRRLVDSRIIPLEYHGWIELDLSQTATSWRQYPEKNHGLVVEVVDASGSRRNSLNYLHGINCQEVKKSAVLNQSSSKVEINYPTLDLIVIKSRLRKKRTT